MLAYSLPPKQLCMHDTDLYTLCPGSPKQDIELAVQPHLLCPFIQSHFALEGKGLTPDVFCRLLAEGAVCHQGAGEVGWGPGLHRQSGKCPIYTHDNVWRRIQTAPITICKPKKNIVKSPDISWFHKQQTNGGDGSMICINTHRNK